MLQIMIIGPTGVGKTAFSEKLWHKIPIEIINGDMGQFYTKLTIGTAKPNLDIAFSPCHLFNIIDEPVHYSVVHYRAAVEGLCKDIFRRKKTPVIAGGSTFYAASLFYPPGFEIGAVIDPSKKKQAEEAVCAIPKDTLWNELAKIDAKRAAQIHPRDAYRLERALLKWFTTGKLPSNSSPVYRPISNKTLIVHLFMNRRPQLERILTQRTEEMIKNGWIDEVRSLLDTEWERFWESKKIIGYSEIACYLRNGNLNSNMLVQQIVKNTLAYAKKQETFFRMLTNKIAKQKDQNIEYLFIDLTLAPADLYINQVYERIQSLNKEA